MPGVLRLIAGRPPADTPLGARGRAMLLVGFGAAPRRSELVALTLGDVETIPERGLRLLIRRSKTDQQGEGQDIAAGPTRRKKGSVRWRRSTPGSRTGARRGPRLDRQRLSRLLSHWRVLALLRRYAEILKRHGSGSRWSFGAATLRIDRFKRRGASRYRVQFFFATAGRARRPGGAPPKA